MRNLVALALLLPMASAALAAERAIAISCDGHWYEGDDMSALPTRSATRIYIVDEDKQTLGYWNPDRELVIPACDRSWERCEVVFEPTQITVRGRLNSKYSIYVDASRRTGSLNHIFLNDDKRHSFWGHCQQTELPKAETERNIF